MSDWRDKRAALIEEQKTKRTKLSVSVRCPPPNVAVSGALVSTIDSGHFGALYGGEAEETALVG